MASLIYLAGRWIAVCGMLNLPFPTSDGRIRANDWRRLIKPCPDCFPRP